MDEAHLLTAARYIEMNPVAANLVVQNEEYLWSSAKAHISKQDNVLAKVAPLLTLVPNWKDFLRLSTADEVDLLQHHERSGRPLGERGFIEGLEQQLRRTLTPQKPGPKKGKKR